ncbi:UDP-N-acetylmuramate--L-alanine ligase [Candidatus Paracaedibacter symbiosus]|uniref:UDP-N-acetylmuramate--L-alanine ligase n=1 Tax=Candidatus Paracaedibacter symbiosus TaxID=244582 RepID=UPI0005096EA9|nr:UDP-N-acetylmuramate--L-alanine ligase [Candidatus Paracaedibacter symbiosus]
MRIPSHSVKQIHFVGIGGIGMSGIAEILHNLGYTVTGSDVGVSANVVRLQELGIQVHIGHGADNIQGSQVVVISTAVKSDNPEILAARKLKIPVIRRAEMLAELMQLKFSVTISGTHGKTTTTSLTAALFDAAGLDPTVVNGGIINSYGTNARLGQGDWIVVEADESDGSFLKLPATIAVVTNIDPEHMDFYPDFDAIKNAFKTFIDRLPFYGLGILAIDHPVVRELRATITDRRILTYGFSEEANVRATNLRETMDGITFDVDLVGNGAFANRALAKDQVSVLPRKIRDIFLPMMGQHNVQNALSVIAIAQELGIDDDSIKRAFNNFKGVKRRFTKTGIVKGVTVIDDYAHHPVEIKTALAAARQACRGKVVTVMQPHRYSRLHFLFEDFANCFEQADEVFIAPVYSAGETPIEGACSESLVAAVRATGKNEVHYLGDPEQLAPAVASRVKEGDMILCLGAGTITHWAAVLPQQLDVLLHAGKSVA